MARTTLQTLPAELRNKIYELAFTCDTEEDETTDLCTAQPPNKALTLVSRQLYNEASGIYRDNYRRFWTESNFTITTTTSRETEAAKESLDPLRVQDVAQITRLHISTPAMEITWHPASGLWHREKPRTPGPPCHIGITWRDHTTYAQCYCNDEDGSTLPEDRVPLQKQIQHVLDFTGSFGD